MENFSYDMARWIARTRYAMENDLYLQIFVSIAILFVLFLIRKKVAVLIIGLIQKIASVKQKQQKELLKKALYRPIQYLIILFGFFCVINILPLKAAAVLGSIFVLKLVIILIVSWIIYNFCDVHSLIFSAMEKRMHAEISKTVLPFLSNILKLIVIALATVVVISELGYNISGFIAGLGLGGLAFALAAQNTAANIFGGVVIVLDKMLVVGDWVKIGEIEGVVEEINLRSTRIRTFSDAIVIVPNSEISGQAMTNWSKMEKRLLNFTVELSYETTREQAQVCLDEIRYMLLQHPQVIQETVIVALDSFEVTGLKVHFYFYSGETGWKAHKQIKEDINLKIMEIVEQAGAKFTRVNVAAKEK